MSEAISERASGISGSYSDSAGKYISGISVQAYKNEMLIATHSVGQDLGRGVVYSPVSLARTAATYQS